MILVVQIVVQIVRRLILRAQFRPTGEKLLLLLVELVGVGVGLVHGTERAEVLAGPVILVDGLLVVGDVPLTALVLQDGRDQDFQPGLVVVEGHGPDGRVGAVAVLEARRGGQVDVARAVVGPREIVDLGLNLFQTVLRRLDGLRGGVVLSFQSVDARLLFAVFLELPDGHAIRRCGGGQSVQAAQLVLRGLDFVFVGMDVVDRVRPGLPCGLDLVVVHRRLGRRLHAVVVLIRDDVVDVVLVVSVLRAELLVHREAVAGQREHGWRGRLLRLFHLHGLRHGGVRRGKRRRVILHDRVGRHSLGLHGRNRDPAQVFGEVVHLLFCQH